jgi:hypothetical protein
VATVVVVDLDGGDDVEVGGDVPRVIADTSPTRAR